MARFSLEKKTEKKSKPVDFYAKYKSKEKAFVYYNGSEEVPIEMPFKFAVINQYATVTGYNQKNSCGVFSNEVRNTKRETLTVRTWKPEGNIIAEGFWNEIKPTVVAQGGAYTRSIYAVLEDGTPVNLQVAKSASQEWSSFCKEFGGGYDNPNFDTNWVEMTGAENRKNGSIEYSVPQFSFGKKITAKQDELIQPHVKNIGEYMEAYFSIVKEPETTEQEIDF